MSDPDSRTDQGKHPDSYKDATRLAQLGRDPAANHGVVNPPVYHASTILFPTAAALRAGPKPLRKGETQYGRAGTPTTFAFEDSVAALEGGFGGIAVPSGLAAIAGAYLGLVKAGDHVLVSDSVYNPNRAFCDGPLTDFGVEVEYYDPLIGAGIAALMRPNTKLVFVESPGSITFEVQDLPAIAEQAHDAGALVVADNTWASPLFCRPLDLGCDVVIHAATKYFNGHSDAMLGVIVAKTEALYHTLRDRTQRYGYAVGPDDVYLNLRGLRTLSVRLARHQESALQVALWLSVQREVERVLHPGLPDDPGHDLWKRDFAGASGLFGVILKPVPETALDRMLDGLRLFGMGYSWGGYESLCVPTAPAKARTATTWSSDGPSLRVYVGLEDANDLIDDLKAGLQRLSA